MAVESVWALSGAELLEVVIDNVPFFARDATLGDVIRITEEDGDLWFAAMVRRSGNSLIRLVFFDDLGVDRVRSDLGLLGCATEYLGQHRLLAVNIPAATRLTDIQDYLAAGAQGGRFDYEEPILRQ